MEHKREILEELGKKLQTLPQSEIEKIYYMAKGIEIACAAETVPVVDDRAS